MSYADKLKAKAWETYDEVEKEEIEVVRLSDALTEIEALEDRITTFDEWQRDREEREAACCPEDVGFDEYIGVLTTKIEALEEQSAYLKAAAHSFSTDAINAADQLTALRHAAAELSLPLEALLSDRESRRWIAPEVWAAMEAGIIKMRSALFSTPQPPAPTGWQPAEIEPTAKFLLLSGKSEEGVVWRDVGVYQGSDEVGRHFVDKYGAGSYPTHWMPLPQPPAQEKDK